MKKPVVESAESESSLPPSPPRHKMRCLLASKEVQTSLAVAAVPEPDADADVPAPVRAGAAVVPAEPAKSPRTRAPQAASTAATSPMQLRRRKPAPSSQKT